MTALTLLICYGMVRLSICRPAKLAASVSPVAAGLPLSLLLHRYSSLMQYSRVIPYEFPFLYMGIYGAVLLGLECMLSVWIVMKILNKEGIPRARK